MQVGMHPPVAVSFGSTKSPLEQKADRLGRFLKAQGLKDPQVVITDFNMLAVRVPLEERGKFFTVMRQREENQEGNYYLPRFEGVFVGLV